MSKIQDALKKIQRTSSALGSADKLDPAGEFEQLGQVVLASEGSDDSLDEQKKVVTAREYIEIDSVALRKKGYLAPLAQERQLAEQYRILKRPILENVFGKNGFKEEYGNLLMVTSALPGDGKTFNCINLALSMANERDVSVLLVDADVAKPQASELFGVSDRLGLTDLMRDESLKTVDLILPTSLAGLHILPAGGTDVHATELLASNRMKALVTELSSSNLNRIVIFDSPPLLVTSESRVLSNYMGQIAMIVCAGKTAQRAVVEALDGVDDAKAVNLVLNQASRRVGAGGYAEYQYAYGVHGEARD